VTTLKPYLRLIGDVHGKISDYLNITNDIEYSIQIGDLGFDYSGLEALNPLKHKVLAGNHDNYAKNGNVFINQTPHFLGDYGVHTVPGIGSFFFVRGGRSIDRNMRIEGHSWWPDEELSYSEAFKALDLYNETKPNLVLSHECPASVIDFMSDNELRSTIKPSLTANLLDNMFQSHQPRMWFFGHHHKHFSTVINRTYFHCLQELETFDFYYLD
jgi:3',5'-cyclic AMP phosphodiesterase CpdA